MEMQRTAINHKGDKVTGGTGPTRDQPNEDAGNIYPVYWGAVI